MFSPSAHLFPYPLISSSRQFPPLVLSHFQALATGCKKLGCLKLWSSTVTDDGLSALSTGCSKLKTLELLHCKTVTSEGVAAIAGGCCDSLEVLDLSHCDNIGDKGVLALAACAKLQSLSLNSCVLVTDTGIAALRKCSAVKSLCLGDTGVSDAGLAAIAPGLPSLETINLTLCASVSDAGLAALAAYCPLLMLVDLKWCLAVTDAGKALFAPKDERGCGGCTKAGFGPSVRSEATFGSSRSTGADNPAIAAIHV